MFRTPRIPYETTVLVLQGGGALGSYQAGVYAALSEAGIMPDWVAGISIGAINAALIAGNPPERRLERLQAFWNHVSHSAGVPVVEPPTGLGNPWFDNSSWRVFANALSASRALMQGQDGFFVPRVPPFWGWPPGTDGATSFYDMAPLRATLAELIDLDELNSRDRRVTVGAVNVESGNFRYFDSARERLGIEHIMASAALPPAFAPVYIEGEGYCWDGGLVSNTPLEYVINDEPRRDTLAFQVDLWSARGPLPKDLMDVFERQKDIQYSSRTRKGSDSFEWQQNLRHRIAEALRHASPKLLDDPAFRALAPYACDKVMNIIHVVYQSKAYETHAKDYEFSALSMREHWNVGFADMKDTLAMPRVLNRPPANRGVVTHDLHRDHRQSPPTPQSEEKQHEA